MCRIWSLDSEHHSVEWALGKSFIHRDQKKRKVLYRNGFLLAFTSPKNEISAGRIHSSEAEKVPRLESEGQFCCDLPLVRRFRPFLQACVRRRLSRFAAFSKAPLGKKKQFSQRWNCRCNVVMHVLVRDDDHTIMLAYSTKALKLK